MTVHRGKEKWGSRMGVILAVMGSAIGLGNFLRFPGLAAKYGGGHFMIPYFVALILLGLPIAWAEWSIGRQGGRLGYSSSPGIFYALSKSRFGAYIGVFGLIIPVGIYMYYVFIEAWCLYYAVQYLTGGMSMGKDPGIYTEIFARFTGLAENGSLITGTQSSALWYLLVCFALNFIVIFRGLSRGIEKVSMYAIPTLFFCALLVLLRVMTLGAPDASMPERNLMAGLGFMWNPGTGEKTLWESLQNAEMWMAAAGQIFFSLSVGFGIIITYASYLKSNDDVLLSGTTSASGNIFAEVALGGLITIPAAFIFLGPSFVDPTKEFSTFGLGFMTMPNVFSNMPLGRLVGFLWFFLLFLAAFTSSLSMLQPAVAFFEEGLGTNRRAAVTLLGFITLSGSLFIVYFSKDLKALDRLDFWVGNVFIYILATIIIIYFAWVIGAKKGLKEARMGSLLHVPDWVAWIMKYVSPVYLLVLFAVWSYQKMPDYWHEIQTDPVTRYTVAFLAALLLFFGLLIMTAVNRWTKKEESDT